MVHMLMLQEGRPTYSVELVEVLVGVLVDVEELQRKTHLIHEAVFHEASAMVHMLMLQEGRPNLLC